MKGRHVLIVLGTALAAAFCSIDGLWESSEAIATKE